MSKDDLIYDWNTENSIEQKKPSVVKLDDETLRDGLQSPSVKSPQIDAKLQLLNYMDQLNIETVDIGLPAAGPHVVEHTTRLAEEIVNNKLKTKANCAGRTLVNDVRPILEISQKTGLPIEAYLFQGSSPIRQYAEDWDIDGMIKVMSEAISFGVKEGLDVSYVTEDTIRSKPETLETLFKAALEAGAKRLCLCDTVGHATPDGIVSLHNWTRKTIDSWGYTDVKLDWHGHNDRGLGLNNAITAVECGYDRVHATALGIGERIGNSSMDLLLVNLKLLGWIDWDLSCLGDYCRLASEATGVPIPDNYPVIGKDAFETGTGVHAAAVIKALKKGDNWLANRVYSGVPADEFGLEQVISVGPMSGKSNVIFWLEKRGIAVTDELVDAVFEAAKKSTSVMTDDEVMSVVNSVNAKGANS